MRKPASQVVDFLLLAVGMAGFIAFVVIEGERREDFREAAFQEYAEQGPWVVVAEDGTFLTWENQRKGRGVETVEVWTEHPGLAWKYSSREYAESDAVPRGSTARPVREFLR